MYKPYAPPTLRRYSLACSSDQKNTDFRQKTSMMFGPVSLAKFTSGTKTMGLAAFSSTRYLSSLSISICSGWVQCVHSVSMATDRGFPRNCPCTKGTANASMAQAEYTCSPVLKIAWWGVFSTVTGYAHTTAPCSFLNKKVRRFSSLSRMSFTRSTDRFNSLC